MTSSRGQRSAERVRALLVAGGGLYETSLHSMLESFGNVDLRISPRDTEAFAEPLLGRWEVVLLINRSATLGSRERGHFRAYAESGGGIIVLNQAMASYPDWPWYRALAGGRYLDAAADGLPSSRFRLQEQIIAFPVGEHPITARLTGRPFHMLDETYSGMEIASDNTVLLRTRNSTSDGPLVWVSAYSPARVAVILPGFGHGAHLNLAYRFVVEDAIAWAAAGAEARQ